MKTGKVISCFFSLVLLSLIGFANPSLHLDLVRMFDQYGNIPWKYEKLRLDNVATQLRNEPRVVAHIISYGGRRSCIGEAQARASRVKNYLVNERGIDFDRVIWRDGGYREGPTIEIFLPLRGEREPSITPTLLPRDVQIIKSCNQKRRSLT